MHMEPPCTQGPGRGTAPAGCSGCLLCLSEVSDKLVHTAAGEPAPGPAASSSAHALAMQAGFAARWCSVTCRRPLSQHRLTLLQPPESTHASSSCSCLQAETRHWTKLGVTRAEVAVFARPPKTARYACAAGPQSNSESLGFRVWGLQGVAASKLGGLRQPAVRSPAG